MILRLSNPQCGTDSLLFYDWILSIQGAMRNISPIVHTVELDFANRWIYFGNRLVKLLIDSGHS